MSKKTDQSCLSTLVEKYFHGINLVFFIPLSLLLKLGTCCKRGGGVCGNLMSYEWGVSPNLMISDEGGSKKHKNHLISYMDDP